MKRQFAIKEYPVAIVKALLDLDICNREAYDSFVNGLTVFRDTDDKATSAWKHIREEVEGKAKPGLLNSIFKGKISSGSDKILLEYLKSISPDNRWMLVKLFYDGVFYISKRMAIPNEGSYSYVNFDGEISKDGFYLLFDDLKNNNIGLDEFKTKLAKLEALGIYSFTLCPDYELSGDYYHGNSSDFYISDGKVEYSIPYDSITAHVEADKFLIHVEKGYHKETSLLDIFLKTFAFDISKLPEKDKIESPYLSGELIKSLEDKKNVVNRVHKRNVISKSLINDLERLKGLLPTLELDGVINNEQIDLILQNPSLLEEYLNVVLEALAKKESSDIGITTDELNDALVYAQKRSQIRGI